MLIFCVGPPSRESPEEPTMEDVLSVFIVFCWSPPSNESAEEQKLEDVLSVFNGFLFESSIQ